MSSLSQTIQWVDTQTELPDDDQTVLIALIDGEVWTGYRDAGQWRYVSGDPIHATVTYWAAFPPPPASGQESEPEANDDDDTDFVGVDEPEYCDRCGNTGHLICHCGGDICCCEYQGEIPCPDCS